MPIHKNLGTYRGVEAPKGGVINLILNMTMRVIKMEIKLTI